MEFSSIEGKLGYDYIVENTDPSLVYFELDCGWATVAGQKPLEILNRHPGRIRMLHLSDYVARQTDMYKPKEGAEGTELGTGITDFNALFGGAQGHGIEHAFVEQASSAKTQMESAEIDYKFLQRFSQ
jgi:sugar phosphate isomerase/epimerase